MIIGGVWLQIGLTIVIAIGMWEFYRAFGEIGFKHFAGLALAVVYIALISDGNHFTGWISLIFPAILLVVSYMAFFVMRRESYKPNETAVTILGFFYIAITMSTIYLLREGQALGMFYVWLVLFRHGAAIQGHILQG